MEQTDVARVLAQIAAFLELKGENPYRIRAYHAAARAVTGYAGDLDAALASGALAELTGIGPATLDIVEDVVHTGRSQVLEDLRAQVPPGLTEMLRIAGLGVSKVRQIHESLGIETIASLEEAARDGRLAKLPRFGRKTAENVLKGIDLLRQSGGYRLFHHARDEAQSLVAALRTLPGVRRAEAAGSVRRFREIIRDLDLVVEIDGDPSALSERLRGAPGVTETIAAEKGGVTLRFQSGTVAEIYPTTAESFGLDMVRATGSEEHVAALRARAADRGLAWSDAGLLRDGRLLETPTEESVYDTLELAWIAPELREGMGEIEAAAAGTLPDLIQRDDLQGLLHFHSDYSDGTSTIAEWTAAAARAGYRYIGVTDHSQALAASGGLAVAEIDRQHAEIDEANARQSAVRVLKGIEADILPDGSLDYAPATRSRFDFVIASVHTALGMSVREMTERVLKAMDDPTVAILGHPTGRLLLARDSYPLDLDRVFAKAAADGIAIEINADPQRLDLDWRILRLGATEAGVAISIGADAHGTSTMSNVDIGVGLARKGWLGADRVLNTWSCDEFLAFAQRRRS